MIGHTATATATEMQNNFGRYLALDYAAFKTDQHPNLEGETDIDQAKEERLREKYEITD